MNEDLLPESIRLYASSEGDASHETSHYLFALAFLEAIASPNDSEIDQNKPCDGEYLN